MLWEIFRREATIIRSQGFHLAGGTALALQIGHRESHDFDFFSRAADAGPIRTWLEETFADLLVRDADHRTVHAEIAGVKVSFIAGYRYPLTMPPVTADAVDLANITDIALMKMLAITHRATLRDYIDLAAILRDHRALASLLEKSKEKYGPSFNAMLPLRAMVHFDDLDGEMPALLDASLAASWQDVLRKAVRGVAM